MGNARSIGVPAPQGEGGFDSCWYPVALSSELARGQLRSTEFLGGRIVVFRGESGHAHVLSAFCRHLGADLGVGQVVGDELQCAFHHWRYDEKGHCTAVPAGDPVPKAARLHCYPASESMGLIWAFHGEAPSYPVPRFEKDDTDLRIRSYEAPNVLPVDPIVQLLNAFDLQHFRVVHGLDLQADPFTFDGPLIDCIFRFTAPELGEIQQARRIWGTSCVTMNGGDRRPSLAAGLCPLPGHRTRMYVVNAMPRSHASDEATLEAALAAAKSYALRLIAEDWPILRTIRFQPEMLVRSDKLLARALHWAAGFPRASFYT
jgi:nitrite reductase/ring-hydroxylating ferredoxin subunit